MSTIAVAILVPSPLLIFTLYIRCISFMDCIADSIKRCRHSSSHVGGMAGENGAMLCILFAIFLI